MCVIRPIEKIRYARATEDGKCRLRACRELGIKPKTRKSTHCQLKLGSLDLYSTPRKFPMLFRSYRLVDTGSVPFNPGLEQPA